MQELRMAVFKNKKGEKKSFAFVENQTTNASPNDVKDFIQGGRGQVKYVPNPNGRPKLANPEQKKTKPITIYLSEKEKKKLEQMAQERGTSISNYLRSLLFSH